MYSFPQSAGWNMFSYPADLGKEYSCRVILVDSCLVTRLEEYKLQDQCLFSYNICISLGFKGNIYAYSPRRLVPITFYSVGMLVSACLV